MAYSLAYSPACLAQPLLGTFLSPHPLACDGSVNMRFIFVLFA